MTENGIVVSQPQISGLNMFANQESFNTGYKMAQILSASTIIPDSYKSTYDYAEYVCNLWNAFFLC